MADESEIRSRLAGVVAGNDSERSLAEWIDDVTWQMPRDNSRAALLATAIDRLFAEYDDHGAESALKRGLSGLLNNISESIREPIGPLIPQQARPTVSARRLQELR